MSENNLNSENETYLYGSILTASEAGIGTLAHSFRLPFRGHLLSLNQLFILNTALGKKTIYERPSKLIHISIIACAVKAVSPTYKKITPIIAIMAETLLFYLPVTICNMSLISRIFGSILSSLFATVQSLIGFI